MLKEKFLTVREVSQILNLTERQVIDLAESGKLPAYKVAGVYLRFRRQEIEEYKNKIIPQGEIPSKSSLKERIVDFFYFNDFYLISTFIIIVLIFIIFGLQ